MRRVTTVSPLLLVCRVVSLRLQRVLKRLVILWLKLLLILAELQTPRQPLCPVCCSLVKFVGSTLTRLPLVSDLMMLVMKVPSV